VSSMSRGITAEDIWYSYSGKIRALRGAFLSANPGEICVLLGANGSGKSTLLYIIAGLLKPEKGYVLYDGKDISLLGSRYRMKVGMLFQNPDDQIFNISVREELAYGLRQLGYKGDRLEEKILDTARRFRICDLLDRSPYELSFGEKKIVMLAAVTIHDPEIVILDEPFANLGANYRKKIMDYIDNAKEKNKIIIIATHDPFIALRLADRVTIIRDGKTIFSGSKKEFATRKLFREADLEDPCTLLSYIWDPCKLDY